MNPNEASPPTSGAPGDDTRKRPATPTSDDNPLESIGKAIVDPVESAAEDEEPDSRGLPPVTPGG